jgi:hypothetical protein
VLRVRGRDWAACEFYFRCSFCAARTRASVWASSKKKSMQTLTSIACIQAARWCSMSAVRCDIRSATRRVPSSPQCPWPQWTAALQSAHLRMIAFCSRCVHESSCIGCVCVDLHRPCGCTSVRGVWHCAWATMHTAVKAHAARRRVAPIQARVMSERFALHEVGSGCCTFVCVPLCSTPVSH